MASKLRRKLIAVLRRHSASGLLFSGGLDSAILARFKPGLGAITVSLNSSGEDLRYAKFLAQFLHLRHYQRSIDSEEAIAAIPEVIRILRSFDPAIPNDLVVYFGLQEAKRLGIKEVITGDGSDELFAGYSYMQKMNDLPSYIRRIARRMQFSSNKIGKFFKIKIVQPFLDKQVINFALKVPAGLKIKKQKGKTWGKWILRQAFQDLLPEKIIWQKKRPLEYGSGMRRIRDIISARENKGERFYYYQIYRRIFGEVPQAKKGQRGCPGCGTNISTKAQHCSLCGWAAPVSV